MHAKGIEGARRESFPRRMHLGRMRSPSFRSGVAASTLLSDARGCSRTISLATMDDSEAAWMVSA